MRWHKVQYACEEPGCARKAFTEAIEEIPAGARCTGRLRRHGAARIGAGAAVSTAAAGLLSWPIAHAAFVQLAAAELSEPGPGDPPGYR